MGISPNLPIDQIVESILKKFSDGVEEKLIEMPQMIPESNETGAMSPEKIGYESYLDSFGDYKEQIGEIRSIAKTFAESLIELDIIPKKKFAEVKTDFERKIICDYAYLLQEERNQKEDSKKEKDNKDDFLPAKRISREKFESEKGRTNAFRVYQLQKEIERSRLVHIMGDVKNDLIRTLKKGNITDYLTGLYNKRYFDKRITEEVERTKRKGTGPTLSLALLDIDDFSDFNTRYDHLVGDKVLKYIGEFLNENTHSRKTDAAARYGGEEFALILPDVSQEDAARIVAKRLEETVNYVKRKLRDEGVYIENLTFSVGISSIGDNAKDSNSLITNADDALYYVKNKGEKGKNGPEIFDPAKIPDYTKARIEYAEKKKGTQK